MTEEKKAQIVEVMKKLRLEIWDAGMIVEETKMMPDAYRDTILCLGNASKYLGQLEELLDPEPETSDGLGEGPCQTCPGGTTDPAGCQGCTYRQMRDQGFSEEAATRLAPVLDRKEG